MIVVDSLIFTDDDIAASVTPGPATVSELLQKWRQAWAGISEAEVLNHALGDALMRGRVDLAEA
jgi:hypothetical protein